MRKAKLKQPLLQMMGYMSFKLCLLAFQGHINLSAFNDEGSKRYLLEICSLLC